jgi:hypothetical protein
MQPSNDREGGNGRAQRAFAEVQRGHTRGRIIEGRPDLDRISTVNPRYVNVANRRQRRVAQPQPAAAEQHHRQEQAQRHTQGDAIAGEPAQRIAHPRP